jgi:phosphoribosyl-ATP pyrophosphohydrolase/phosphoribosyl-AMP cyclohydrolase/histidinol dehydrogenase
MLFDQLRQRKATMPEGSFSAKLFQNRKLLNKKILEEAYEVVSFDSWENLRWEIGDLLYFASVLAVDEGVNWQDLMGELGGRHK